MSSGNYLWGIDLGGTKIECAVLSKADPLKVITRHRLPTEAEKGYQHVILQVKRLIELVAKDIGEFPSAVGFGTPGALEPSTQTMKNCNTTSLNGMPLKKDFEEALGIPVKIANDANCFALAETMLGVVQKVKRDAGVVFGVILGTGVGGGLVVNGKLSTGNRGLRVNGVITFLMNRAGNVIAAKQVVWKQ